MSHRSHRIAVAASVLKAGGIVAYPTEAVWGLGCDPYDEFAVRRLLRIKRRKMRQGLILIGASSMHLEPFLTNLAEEERAKLDATWPGAVTWLVPDNGVAPPWIRGAFDSVALRRTAHPTAAALCEAFGGVLVSTSANRSGARPARHAHQLSRHLRRTIDVLMPGAVGGRAKPSEIRDLRSDRVVRDG